MKYAYSTHSVAHKRDETEDPLFPLPPPYLEEIPLLEDLEDILRDEDLEMIDQLPRWIYQE